MIWVKIIAVLCLVAAAVTIVLAYNNAIAKAGRLEDEIKVVEEDRDGWIDAAARENTARAAAEDAAKRRELSRRQLQEERDAAREKLAEVRNAKPENARWLDAAIPPDIVARLRLDGAEAAAGAAGDRVPGAPPAPDARAPVRGDAERGSAQPRR